MVNVCYKIHAEVVSIDNDRGVSALSKQYRDAKVNGAHALRMTSNRLLEWTIKNSIGLLLATGQANARGRVHAVAKNLQKHQLILPSLLGLLLWKLGIQRETYMKTGAFWVGRMLSVADQLHLQYCSEVRKKEVPPQLIGNAMMSVALANPENAISLLAERIKPYLAWAQTVQSGNKVGLTKYFLKQLSEISSELSDLDIPTRCTDSDRATTLLGYPIGCDWWVKRP